MYAGINSRQGYGQGATHFERIRDEQVLHGDDVLGPFRDEAEWELAKWMIKNVGHGQAENLLKLPIIANRAKPSFSNKREFLERVDQLPVGVRWNCVDLEITGDEPDLEKDSTGTTKRVEKAELWYRNPLECVEELIGNPAFQDVMKYSPERLYNDERGESQMINEMWTGSWWWDIQNQLPGGATVAPLIISSDKTHLSNFRGDNSAWPVYLTIGNIEKETRRRVSSNATVLLGYLPIPKFDCFTKESRSLAKYRLFHSCMEIIMSHFIDAGTNGKNMVCADGLIRNVWPIFAAYVADYPEQCLVACCMENRCPGCLVDPSERGNHICGIQKRDQDEVLFLLRRKQEGYQDIAYKSQGLRAIYTPFWSVLPHANIFKSFTPDLLHQLHKGVFKDHLVKWCVEIIGKDEVDARFRSLPSHPGLRHFKNGISHVSQWTGAEHKEMEKVFLGLVATDAHVEIVKAIRSLIDFIYYASLQSHSSQTLLALRTALDDFHAHKQIFIKLNGREQDHFNIPKLHSLDHYEDLIRLFNTESPERLHIDYAKNAYRASNRKDYIKQMTCWLGRQEAVDQFTLYLEWAMNRTTPPTCSFLAERGSNFIPHSFDVFGLWKQIVFKLPYIPEVGSRHTSNIVRAVGPKAEPPLSSHRGRHSPSEPATTSAK
ncbi:hypothetical protein BD779DRAFT_1614047 [Infundibulicybe gibba]|nr:hypothetical protein BD779DRAFT_1614047 [Infundibulicybe gibba]